MIQNVWNDWNVWNHWNDSPTEPDSVTLDIALSKGVPSFQPKTK
jgi:hypothetical protein